RLATDTVRAGRGPRLLVPLRRQVRSHPAVRAGVRVDPGDPLTLGHGLADCHLGNHVSVDRLTPTVCGGVIHGDPGAEPGCGSRPGHGAVFDGVQRITTRAAFATEVGSLVLGTPAASEHAG